MKNFKLPAVLLCLCLAAAPARAAFLFWGRKRADPLQGAKALFVKRDYRQAAHAFEGLLDKLGLKTEELRLAYWFAGQSYERCGDYDRALSVYQIAVRFYSKDEPLNIALGRLYLKTGLYERAREIFHYVLGVTKDSYDAHVGLAEVDAQLGFYGRAQGHYRIATELMPTRDQVLWRAYADCVFRQRKYALARRLCDQALSFAPSDPDTLLLSALIYYDTGLKGAAMAELDKASSAAPERDDLTLRRALWLVSMGRADDSLRLSRSVLARRPDDPLALLAAGLALLRSGQAEEGRECLRQAALGADSAPFVAAAARALLPPAD